MPDPDLLILGAGPAGLSAALHLARHAPDLAARTLVIEKARHPRPKVCAGGLLPDGERILARLGLDVTALPHADAAWAHFSHAGRGGRMRAGRELAFRVFRRDELDAWLLEHVRRAGIPVLEETTVQDVQPAADGVTVLTSRGAFHARAAIGADGSAGVSRRMVERQTGNRRAWTARALEVLTPAADPDPDARLDFLPVPLGLAGYLWDFPTRVRGEDMRCRGIYDANLFPRDDRPPLRELLLREIGRQTDFRLSAAPIRCFHPRASFSVPGLVLAGDAAGADSLLGEGISPALGWGQLAAAAVADAFARGDFSFRDYRLRVLTSRLGRALTFRYVLARLLYGPFAWPPLQRVIWHRLHPLVFWIARHFVINWAAEQ